MEIIKQHKHKEQIMTIQQASEQTSKCRHITRHDIRRRPGTSGDCFRAAGRPYLCRHRGRDGDNPPSALPPPPSRSWIGIGSYIDIVVVVPHDGFLLDDNIDDNDDNRPPYSWTPIVVL